MIFCVDDNSTIREIEVYTLVSTGFEAKGFEDGAALLTALQTETPELIVLDIMLPGEDGVTLLKTLRADPAYRSIPVIMATARDAEMDKIQSLDLGADDYLVKPFGMMEMVARIRAVLRRCAVKPQEKALSCEGITLKPQEHTVTVQGEPVSLTFKEFELLRLFLQNPGIAFTRDQLLSEIWGIGYPVESRTVDMHIKTLRRKLGEGGKLIETVIGVGYRLKGST